VDSNSPLAERMRPRNFSEFLGQHKLLAPNAVLRRSLELDQVPSMILWGPPGCGKTSLANLIRNTTQHHYESLSAVSAGVKDVKDSIASARSRREGLFGRKTILFIDEIHRFNKTQQDALLQAVEDGTLTLIGATTENPSFEVNAALLSRCQLILLAPLDVEQLCHLARRALTEDPRGLKCIDQVVDDEVLLKLAYMAEGDARFLLNQLEWLIGALPPGTQHISLDTLEGMDYHKPLRYDKGGDEHYNLISALHKSIRGSDPQAALYWSRRMLTAGEDPRYLLRRLIRMSVEDIGLADPQATSAQQAYDFLGQPEGLLAIDQLVVYLATAPKSNRAYLASKKVQAVIAERGMLPVPRHLRNAVNKTGRDLGYGKDYAYDHDFPGAFSGQERLPAALAQSVFYEPSTFGYEAEIDQRMKEWARIKNSKLES
jgi:putative ATPase